MPLKNRERIRDEKIDGKIFDMSPAPSYQHSVVNGKLFSIISNGLKDSMCLVFMENIDYKYSKENDNYLEPDIIICCDRNQIRGNSYYGTPKFVAETISPSTVKRDRGIKKDIYEASEHYNLHQKITLRAFPITMTLEEIFVF